MTLSNLLNIKYLSEIKFPSIPATINNYREMASHGNFSFYTHESHFKMHLSDYIVEKYTFMFQEYY